MRSVCSPWDWGLTLLEKKGAFIWNTRHFQIQECHQGLCNVLKVLFTLKYGCLVLCITGVWYDSCTDEIFGKGFSGCKARIFNFLMFCSPLAWASKGRRRRGKGVKGTITWFRLHILHPLPTLLLVLESNAVYVLENKYSWPLNNKRIGGMLTLHSRECVYKFLLPQNLVAPRYPWGIGSPTDSNFYGCTSPCIKWRTSVHVVSPLHAIQRSSVI